MKGAALRAMGAKECLYWSSDGKELTHPRVLLEAAVSTEEHISMNEEC